MVKFDISAEDRALVDQIVSRIMAMDQKHDYEQQDCRMDLIACHANGNPMDFAKLVSADDFNLAHDVYGIRRHIDRKTGGLGGFFSPRCSKGDAWPAPRRK